MRERDQSFAMSATMGTAQRDGDAHLDERLNLGPSVSGDGLWSLMDCRPPEPQLDSEVLRPFFWQFARSRIDRLDVMRYLSLVQPDRSDAS